MTFLEELNAAIKNAMLQYFDACNDDSADAEYWDGYLLGLKDARQMYTKQMQDLELK